MNNRETNQQLTAKFRDKSSVPDDALINDLIIFHVSSWLYPKPPSFFVPKMQTNGSCGHASSCLIQQMSKLLFLRFLRGSLEIHCELAEGTELLRINFLSRSYTLSFGKVDGSQTMRKESGGRQRDCQPTSIMRFLLGLLGVWISVIY